MGPKGAHSTSPTLEATTTRAIVLEQYQRQGRLSRQFRLHNRIRNDRSSRWVMMAFTVIMGTVTENERVAYSREFRSIWHGIRRIPAYSGISRILLVAEGISRDAAYSMRNKTTGSEFPHTGGVTDLSGLLPF